jgi:ElaB/YqjD/DUF883 family membrane-anchored ribosome-binding protein
MASEPVERLAAEADEARGRVAATIDAIQDRLSPSRLISDAVEKVSNGSRGLIQDLGGNARGAMQKHPLAIGAAVAAVGLALMARRSLANARVDLGDDQTDYTDYDDGFGAADTADDSAATDDIASPGAAARLRAGTARARTLAASAADNVEANPLVSILIGLAAGAALGALFPTTETERRLLDTDADNG